MPNTIKRVWGLVPVSELTDPLEIEVYRRLARGWELLSVLEFTRRFEQLGYRPDRTLDCKQIDRSGNPPYPLIVTGLLELKTGRSAYHFEGTRDDNFTAAQALRHKIFSVTRGHILEC